MSLVYTIATLVALLLCVYLVMALLRPEWFE